MERGCYEGVETFFAYIKTTNDNHFSLKAIMVRVQYLMCFMIPTEYTKPDKLFKDKQQQLKDLTANVQRFAY